MEDPKMKMSRKSCDFCYTRKIKCDAQKPRCSQCIVHKRGCTYGAPSRQPRPKCRKVDIQSDDDTSALRTRVRRLELELQQLTKESRGYGEVHENQRGQPEPTPTVIVPVLTVTSEGKGVNYDCSSQALDLPPLEQAIHVVNLFLENFNTVLPLFHPETLLRLLYTTYNLDPRSRDPVAWAAINVVLALAYQQRLMGSSNVHRAVEYLARAQSALSDVVLGDPRLLNIQVLVGMVMLLQAAKDLQPALILIATTLRLAHKIGLHSRFSALHSTLSVARQRANVFWLAYVLDKNLSLRSKQPSIQRDDDIDLDLPSALPQENNQSEGGVSDEANSFDLGQITSVDGSLKMDYFVTRIHLAVIEGGVYDYLYSTASQKRTPEERSDALNSVYSALRQWKSCIPAEFRGLESVQRMSPTVLAFLGVLDATSLMCTSLISQAHAWNPQWMNSLQKYDKEGVALWMPPQWETLVAESRHLLVFTEPLGPMDRWNFWTTGCSYMTAMVSLTANTMQNSLHGFATVDSQLVDTALGRLGSIVQETNNEELRSFHKNCIELHQSTQQKRRNLTTMFDDRNIYPSFHNSEEEIAG
ncbi:hypothetical protein PV08_02237 [Exophiala spinifera]|uniref:Zn(2)-C6 fungal-type domain-containing protein n=1 Tax=Exophiala spinifera TaxID=91928 RepID=A0A0D2AA69_9EURO|nr:uncharacterized protein PV08_02237 [Exophiala spinifera]KIW21657.1 hypothetical protein PV08_02237 [Exophiala spinifera]